MPLPVRNLHTVDTSQRYIVELNVDVPLKTAKPYVKEDPLLVRVNVYRPKGDGPFPVLCTYGPYGKDIHYEQFNLKSYADVNPKHKSKYSAWEVPDPAFWTSKGYAVVRADEIGTGNSPGRLDPASASTTVDGFFDIVEWAAAQPWSSGKVGLLGVSYYALSQWRVAARKPKGLAAMVPWEGMADYYRDFARHGGILSNRFMDFWYNRQVASNQYGLPGRTARKWGQDSLEGVLPPEELAENRVEPLTQIAKSPFRDDDCFRSREFDLADIDVPLLSVANWGAIDMHLRGNVLGYLGVSSRFKYLRFLSGRHDVPFFYDENVELQLSFLDAFLKGEDREGWSVPGKMAPVSVCVRRGNPGCNDPEAERRTFPRRDEWEWPIARGVDTLYHLTHDKGLTTTPASDGEGVVSYDAPKGGVTFLTSSFLEETEMTGHPMVRLSISAEEDDGHVPSEIDLFLTLRHYDADGKEISYTGPTGEAMPISRGWLRVSLRTKTKNTTGLSAILPERDYLSTEVQSVKPSEVYEVDVEIWPTSVVVLPGETLGLEVSSCDAEDVEKFRHDHPDDRDAGKLAGKNPLHFGEGFENWLRLPVIPPRDQASCWAGTGRK